MTNARGFGLDRRELLAGAIATGLASADGIADQTCGDAQSLGAAAARAGVTFGSTIGVDVLGDARYIDILLRESRILTTDLAFKLPFINPERGRFDFSQADRLVTFCGQKNIPLRAHTLIWDYANPDWVKQLSVKDRIYEFDRIIDTVMSRYAGKLHSWDVVNELFWPGSGELGGFRRGPWYDALGKGYVSRAFERAAIADPAAILVLNQDMTERDDDLGRAVRASLMTLLDELQTQGRKVGAIGLQGHIDPTLPFDPAAFEAFLWMLAERRVPVYITELDVLDTALPVDIRQRDDAVAGYFQRFLDIVLKVPAVEMIVTWQIADSKSWYRSDWYRSVTPALPKDWLARPLPFDDRLEPKKSWQAMHAAFCRAESVRRSKNDGVRNHR